jgi:hypothetical protein
VESHYNRKNFIQDEVLPLEAKIENGVIEPLREADLLP